MKLFICCILIIVAGFFAYNEVYKADFILDDDYTIKENIYIKHSFNLEIL